ncbi:MAG: bifunctional heptose 7-phosphate kinase/heptose 1-phosphate adenyltransferase [Synergistaceae bacterium]|nr:bifunctional heptose 7-phosphate kinase/heptose 1-phosphate adenyltransferase [Synergistaceae bacterium]
MRNQTHFSPDALDKIYELCSGGFSDVKVLVVGDIMLDRYISGVVKRISPEAPVPVFLVKDEKYILGGAGNVVMNLRRLGVTTKFLGRVGDDPEGRRVAEMLKASGADSTGLVYRGCTSLKTRLVGNGRQQMMRLDREDIIPPLDEEEPAYISEIESALNDGVKAVIVSDYGKGMFRETLSQTIIKTCAKHKVPVFVDPKGTDWERYDGAFVVTPNLSELSLVADGQLVNDDDAVAEAGRSVRRKYDFANLLVTRSEKGATLIEEDDILHVPAMSVEVFDVSGAGDTVISVAAASVAAGLSLADAVKLANISGQIVVGKVGTSPIESEDLLKFLGASEPSGKVCSAGAAGKQIGKWQKNGEKVVFTNGCFDIFHVGHADSLARAKKLGDRLVVGLNSDESVRALKGPARPVNGQDARARVLSAMSDVDMVVIFDEDTPEELLSRLRPDVVAKGGDYKPEQVAGGQYAKEVVILPLLEGFSTTGLIERMKSDGDK